jgi:hypothetical protein
MLQFSTSRAASIPRTFGQRVADAIASFGCDRVWAKSSGPHVLLGLRGADPFARVTPLGGASYGLAFRAMEAKSTHTNAWEPLLLVDHLAAVVEHALIAIDAIPIEG